MVVSAGLLVLPVAAGESGGCVDFNPGDAVWFLLPHRGQFDEPVHVRTCVESDCRTEDVQRGETDKPVSTRRLGRQCLKCA